MARSCARQVGSAATRSCVPVGSSRLDGAFLTLDGIDISSTQASEDLKMLDHMIRWGVERPANGVPILQDPAAGHREPARCGRETEARSEGDHATVCATLQQLVSNIEVIRGKRILYLRIPPCGVLSVGAPGAALSIAPHLGLSSSSVQTQRLMCTPGTATAGGQQPVGARLPEIWCRM